MPCKVCSDHSSGKHYGIFACDGCAGFFKRSIRRSRSYVCKAKSEGKCVVDKTHRNQCRACRLRKCVSVGMNKDAVQHERGPRNSTLRRQMAMFMNKDLMAAADEVKTLQQDMMLRSLPMQPPLPPFILDLSSRGRESGGYSGPPVPPYILDLSSRGREAGAYSAPLLSPYPPIASEMAIEATCGAAAEMLFMNIRWIKTQCEAAKLSLGDQLTLIERSSNDLFVLGAAQYLLQMNFNPMLCAYKIMENNDGERCAKILAETQLFHALLVKLTQAGIDDREYSCLRSIVLYNIEGRDGEKDRLQEPSKISSLQSEAITDLVSYLNLAKAAQPLRYKSLMLLLEQLKAISSNTIEELFFRRRITSPVGINRLILDMYSEGKF